MCGQTSVPGLQLFLKTYLLWKKKKCKILQVLFLDFTIFNRFELLSVDCFHCACTVCEHRLPGLPGLPGLPDNICSRKCFRLHHSFPSRLVFSGEAELPSICAVSYSGTGVKFTCVLQDRFRGQPCSRQTWSDLFFFLSLVLTWPLLCRETDSCFLWKLPQKQLFSPGAGDQATRVRLSP